MDRYQQRRDRLLALIAPHDVGALLVTNHHNVAYLTGFGGEDSFLVVGSAGTVLISDSRFATQLPEECPGLEVYIRPTGVSVAQAVGEVIRGWAFERIGVESESMTLALHERLAGRLTNLSLVSTCGLVEQLRQTKDDEEIAEIRAAVRMAEQAMTEVRRTLAPDQTEKQISDLIDSLIRQAGGKGASFETIVAVGTRAALPHARPTQRKIREAPFVLIDWGAHGGRYKSDLTRVLVTGTIPPKLERIYGVVLEAQLAGIAAIRPGATCHEVDEAARRVIEQAGHGPDFGHGLGHGIGLEVHEGPRLSRGVETTLEPGMVITVEPGIYLPDFGGVRIEDDVLVTSEGHEVLSTIGKSWREAILA